MSRKAYMDLYRQLGVPSSWSVFLWAGDRAIRSGTSPLDRRHGVQATEPSQ